MYTLQGEKTKQERVNVKVCKPISHESECKSV